jgi:NADH-quinone oxidoreductase subunit J
MIVAFYFLASLVVLGAILAVHLRNVVHAVLSLLFCFAALAGIFVLLLAEFIAAVQVLVYVGAVGILMLFAIMLTRDVTGEKVERVQSRGRCWGYLLAAVWLVGILLPAIAMAHLSDEAPAWPLLTTADLGVVLMRDNVAVVEAMALLLTAALIGAVVLAMEEPGVSGRKQAPGVIPKTSGETP